MLLVMVCTVLLITSIVPEVQGPCLPERVLAGEGGHFFTFPRVQLQGRKELPRQPLLVWNGQWLRYPCEWSYRAFDPDRRPLESL